MALPKFFLNHGNYPDSSVILSSRFHHHPIGVGPTCQAVQNVSSFNQLQPFCLSTPLLCTEAFLNHSVAFNPISSDSVPSQRAKLAHFHQPLLTPCIIPWMFLKTVCSPISTVRWGSQHVTHYHEEGAQMIYRETVHPDVISTIQPFCFSDVWEAQMFPTAAAPSKRVSKLPAVTAKLYPEESCPNPPAKEHSLFL